MNLFAIVDIQNINVPYVIRAQKINVCPMQPSSSPLNAFTIQMASMISIALWNM